MKQSILIFWVVVLLLSGCKDDEIVPQDIGYGYWPANTGHWVEYEVDSLWQEDVIGARIAAHYLLREVIDSQYVDAQGRAAQRIERFVQDSTGAWIIKDIWTQTRDNTQAEKTEENLRKLKLAFPVRAYQQWNAHVYIGDDGLEFTTDDEMEVEVDEVDAPWGNGVLSFDSTCTVVSTYETNFIVTKRFEERYAKNVGLVSKLWMQYDKQDGVPMGDGINQDTVGFRMTMKVVAYGN